MAGGPEITFGAELADRLLLTCRDIGSQLYPSFHSERWSCESVKSN